jgi:hypothetical protein
MTIGYYEHAGNVVDGTPILWHSLIENRYWTLSMEQPRLNDTIITSKVNSVIVDTGSSYVVLPADDY